LSKEEFAMQKMLYVNERMALMIEKISIKTDKPFSRVVEEALTMWMEKKREFDKDPVELLYEAIELLKRK
jgi:hypothetical protein